MKKLFKNKVFAVFAAVGCTLLWGTAFPFIKSGYAAFSIAEGDIGSKLLFAGLRFSIAGLLVLAALWISSRRVVLPSKNELPPILLLGGVQTFAQYLFTYIGLGLTGGANTSVITACSAFFTVLAAPIFFRNDRLTALKILGCVLGFGGVLLINGGAELEARGLLGDGLILCSTVCAAAGNIIAKRKTSGIDPITLTAYQLLFGGSLLAVLGLVTGGRLDLTVIKGGLIMLWLALVSAVAFAVWTALLKYHPAGKFSVFNLLVPVIGTVLSGVMLGENILRPALPISLLLISAGIAAVNISKEKPD